MRGEHTAARLLGLKTRRQIHFYSNRDCLPQVNAAYAGKEGLEAFDWGRLYCELFKPGPVLAGRIQSIKQGLGGDYYAAVFRFQNLLWDFHEYHFKSIADGGEAEKLRCPAETAS